MGGDVYSEAVTVVVAMRESNESDAMEDRSESGLHGANT